jgi:hypothetical protein
LGSRGCVYEEYLILECDPYSLVNVYRSLGTYILHLQGRRLRQSSKMPFWWSLFSRCILCKFLFQYVCFISLCLLYFVKKPDIFRPYKTIFRGSTALHLPRATSKYQSPKFSTPKKIYFVVDGVKHIPRQI